MIVSFLVIFFNLFANVFYVLVIARIIMSWIVPNMPGNVLGRLLIDLTEPVLAPLRKVLPRSQGFDLAPIAAVMICYLIQTALSTLPIR